MTRITLTLAATALTISLSPAAQAYGNQPGINETLDNVEVVNALYGAQTTKPYGVCERTISPILTKLLALTPEIEENTTVALACAAE
jgi:hypothetical protein